MRHILTACILSALPVTAFAADFTAPLNATAATVYPEGAKVSYRASVALPTGSHRVLLPYQSGGYGFSAPQIQVSGGVSIGAVNYLTNVTYDQDALLNAEQRSAKDSVEKAEKAIRAKNAQLRELQLQLAALDTQKGFLNSISGAEIEDADPAQLRALSQMVLAESETAIKRRLDLEDQAHAMGKELQKLNDALTQANRAFSRLSPPTGTGDMMAVSVEVSTPLTANFVIKSTIREASWSADYDFRLTYGDNASLNVARKVIVTQNTGQAWADIDLVLSTASPFTQAEPSNAGQNMARIDKPMPVGKLVRSQSMAYGAPVTAEAAGMADTRIVAQSTFNGLSLRYIYPRKVTLETNEQAQLTLDKFDLPVQTSLLAIPRRDQTAFVMAAITNNTKEPLLPGSATFYRDGDFIGQSYIQMIPAGGKHDQAFGSMEGIRLTYTALRRETGDTGIITSANTREDIVEFAVENLTDKPQDVRAMFALPYSEQENLIISTRINPNPSQTDVDDIRGVAAWDIQIAAGETQKVRLTTTLDWPKGFDLSWHP